MVKFPDYIVDKKAVSERNSAFGLSAFALFFSFGAFSAESTGLGVILGIIGFAFIIYGANIKTKKRYRGGAGIYK